MHVEIPRPRDATELNNDGIIKLFDVYYQTEPILSISSKEISSATTLVSIQVFFQQLTCNVMFFLSKSFFCKCPCLSVNGIFDDVISDVVSM